ncbi:MAG: hypothetical protein M3R17_19470, partial [Bacteroidota bacterium]|nr:hypothetical protein [Bacteroidota bacterium]
MNLVKKCFITFTLFVFGNHLKAQINPITTAVSFLMIAPDSRAGAMGETGVASSPDVYSMHWNIARLAFADKKFGVGLAYT